MRVLAFLFFGFLTNPSYASFDTYLWFTTSLYYSGNNFAQRYDGQSQDSKDYLRNVCGTMSLLAIHNYYNLRNQGRVDEFSTSREGVRDAIYRLFEGPPPSLNKSPTWYYQKTTDLQWFAAVRWNWRTAKIRSSTAYPTLEASFQQLRSDVDMGRPAITLMKGFSYFEPRDANGRTIGVEHFITIIYADNSNVSYFDPWDGQIKWIDALTFKNGWVNTFISVVTQP